jgi:hypothetical protein
MGVRLAAQGRMGPPVGFVEPATISPYSLKYVKFSSRLKMAGLIENSYEKCLINIHIIFQMT